MGVVLALAGPPGAGKTSLVCGLLDLLHRLNRVCITVNLDPANDHSDADLDLRTEISVEDVMEELGLGPNGAALFAMQHAAEHAEQLMTRIKQIGDTEVEKACSGLSEAEQRAVRASGATVIIDLPGQAETYAVHDSVARLLWIMGRPAAKGGMGARVVAIHLTESTFFADAEAYTAACVLALAQSNRLEVAAIHVMTKADLVGKLGISSPLESLLCPSVESDTVQAFVDGPPRLSARRRLARTLMEVVVDEGQLRFSPLSMKDPRTLLDLLWRIDRCSGYSPIPGVELAYIWDGVSSEDLEREYCEFSRGGPVPKFKGPDDASA